jgi:hypothetical protein
MQYSNHFAQEEQELQEICEIDYEPHGWTEEEMDDYSSYADAAIDAYLMEHGEDGLGN